MTANLPLGSRRSVEVQVEPLRQFDTLQEGYRYANNLANELIRSGKSVIASRIYEDRITKPKSRQIQVLGVTSKAAKECKRLSPNGKWWVQVDKAEPYQFMAWYSRFLPYAYAMMTSEDGFEAMGIDYDSINSYFKTCLGFVMLGQGEIEVKIPPNALNILARGEDIHAYLERSGQSFIFVKEDLELFETCYNTSCKVKSPSLPWDEAYCPCFCFVAFQRPDLFRKYIQERNSTRSECREDYRTQHVLAVAEKAGLPVPEFKWK